MKLPRFRKQVVDLFVVVLLVIVASAATLALPISFLLSTLLFFGLPSLYLVGRNPRIFSKAAIAALIFGGIWGFSFDFIAELNGAWDWTPDTRAVISHDLFGVVSADVMVWFILWVFLVVAFYEYFVDGSRRRISKKALPITVTGAVIAAAVVLLHTFVPDLLRIPYTYFLIGGLTLAPYVYVVLKEPGLIRKSLSVVPFFVFLYLACEMVSLHKRLWIFPGEYIGTVTLYGITFPLEEFFIWIVASSAVVVAYYEFAVDDEK